MRLTELITIGSLLIGPLSRAFRGFVARGGGEVSVVRRPWSKANVYRSQNSRYMSASGLLLIVPSIATLKSGSTWAVKVTPAENNVRTSMFVYTGEGDADSPSKQNNPVAQRDDRREASFLMGAHVL